MTDIILTHGFFLDEDPKEQEIMRPYPPLGILYLSQYLQDRGIQVDIVDTTFIKRKIFEERLLGSDCRVVGIYTTHGTRSSVIRQISAARQAGFRIIAGGPDSAVYPESYLTHGADVVVIGEGEQTLTELLSCLGNPDKMEAVDGLVFRGTDGRLISTPPREMLDINRLPWPDRKGIDLYRYLDAWKTSRGQSSLTLATARGCRFGCRWCSHAVFGKTERRRDPADCAEEAAWLVSTYQPDQLWYTDDVFTMDHAWVERFAAELASRQVQVPFECISRADRMDSEALVRTLARMGCRQIWIGAESGSDRVLRAMGRGVTAAQVCRAVALCKSQGIQTGLFIMWGYEGETPQDIAKTVDLVSCAQPELYFTTLVYPIGQTRYYQDVECKLVRPSDWAASSDRDLEIADRKPRSFYRLADRWLHQAVQARRLAELDPAESARSTVAAEEARKQLEGEWHA